MYGTSRLHPEEPEKQLELGNQYLAWIREHPGQLPLNNEHLLSWGYNAPQLRGKEIILTAGGSRTDLHTRCRHAYGPVGRAGTIGAASAG